MALSFSLKYFSKIVYININNANNRSKLFGYLNLIIHEYIYIYAFTESRNNL